MARKATVLAGANRVSLHWWGYPDVTSEKRCPDCDEPLEEMELQGTDVAGSIKIVAPSDDGGFLSSFKADEVLSPVPYVCPECRRTLFYAEP